MDIKNFIKSSIHTNPLDELKVTFGRTPSIQYQKFSSLKGRAICVVLVPVHAFSVVAKAIFYICASIVTLFGSFVATAASVLHLIGIIKEPRATKLRNELFLLTFGFAANAMVSPLGQAAQVCKAVGGIFSPAAYFKEKKKPQMFIQQSQKSGSPHNLNPKKNLTGQIPDAEQVPLPTRANNGRDFPIKKANNSTPSSLKILEQETQSNIPHDIQEEQQQQQIVDPRIISQSSHLPVSSVTGLPTVPVDSKTPGTPSGLSLSPQNNTEKVTFEERKRNNRTSFPMVNSGDLINKPAETLRSLIIKIGKGSNELNFHLLMIGYNRQAGVGKGVTRDCMSRLAQNLSAKLNLLEPIKSDDRWDDNLQQIFEDLGTLLDFHLIDVNSKNSISPMPIGNCLHENYFSGIFAFTDRQRRSSFDSLSSLDIFKIMAPLYIKKETKISNSSSSRQKLLNFIEWNGSKISPEEMQEHVSLLTEARDDLLLDLPENSLNRGVIDINQLNELKKTLCDEHIVYMKRAAQAYHAIAKGFCCSEETWNGLRFLPPQRIERHVQGQFGKNFLEHVLWFKTPNPMLESSIKNWIKSKEEEALRQFLTCVTGSPCIPVDKIKICETITGEFHINSCYNQIVIPKHIEKINESGETIRIPLPEEELTMFLDSISDDPLVFNLL